MISLPLSSWLRKLPFGKKNTLQIFFWTDSFGFLCYAEEQNGDLIVAESLLDSVKDIKD